MRYMHIGDRFFYGWILAVAGFMIGLVSFGIRYSFGVFFKSIEVDFSLNRAATSAVFATYMLICGVISFLGGTALDKYGPRKVALIMGLFTGASLLLASQAVAAWQLFLAYGLLLAIGTGAIFTVVNSTVSRWFNKRRGVVLGFTSSGGAAGEVFFAPLATYLITAFNWRVAFIVLGLIAWLVISSMSMLLKREPREMGLLPDGVKSEPSTASQDKKKFIPSKDLSLSEALRTANFWFLAMIWFLLSISVHLVLTHAAPNAIDLGISPINASVILSLVGVGAVVGRISAGHISDIIGRKIPAVGCALLQVILLVWLVWIRELWMFYVFAFFFGYTWGGLGSMTTVLISDVFGIRSIGAIMGAIVVGWSIGAAIGPTFTGAIYDASHSYTLAFLISAMVMVIAIVCAALVKTGKRTG